MEKTVTDNYIQDFFGDVESILRMSVRYGLRVSSAYFPDDQKSIFQLTMPVDGVDRFHAEFCVEFRFTLGCDAEQIAAHVRENLAYKLGKAILAKY